MITHLFRKPYVLRTALQGGFGNLVSCIVQDKYLGKVRVSILAQKTSFGKRINRLLFSWLQVYTNYKWASSQLKLNVSKSTLMVKQS